MLPGDIVQATTSSHNDPEERSGRGLNLSEKPQDQRKIAFKAHSAAVTSLRVFEHGDGRSFATSGEDCLIKVYSLQKEQLGPLTIELLGVIDLKKAYVPKEQRFWRFPYETEAYGRRQEQNFREVMREIVKHEWLDTH
jgi:WD40 repeat protein